IKAYSIDLNQLIKFLLDKQYSLVVTEISKQELREFLESIAALRPKSIKRKIASIKVLFNFLEFDDVITVNPMRKLRIKIREPWQLPRIMNLHEIRKVFKLAYGNLQHCTDRHSYAYFEKIRDLVVIELLFATGARVSEIANLKTENVDLS